MRHTRVLLVVALTTIISGLILSAAYAADENQAPVFDGYIFNNEAVLIAPVDNDSFNIYHCFTKSDRETPEPFRPMLHGGDIKQILEDSDRFNCQARNHEPIRYDKVATHMRQARLDLETFFGREPATRRALPKDKPEGLAGDIDILRAELAPEKAAEFPPFRINPIGADFADVRFRAGLTEFQYPANRLKDPYDALQEYMLVRYSPLFGPGNQLQAYEGNAGEMFRQITSKGQILHFNAAAASALPSTAAGMPKDPRAMEAVMNVAAGNYINHGLLFLEIADIVNSQRENNPECLQMLADIKAAVDKASNEPGIPAELQAIVDNLSREEKTNMTAEDFLQKSPDGDGYPHQIVTANLCTERLLELEKLLIALKHGRSEHAVAKLDEVLAIYENRIHPQLHVHALPGGPTVSGSISAD